MKEINTYMFVVGEIYLFFKTFYKHSYLTNNSDDDTWYPSQS